MSAPLAAGACALLFQCRGGVASWADLKQILTDTAGVAGLAPAAPNNTFGYGFMQMATACAAPATNVDVWLRDHASDTGVEPFVGSIAWLSPDIEVLDAAGNPVANPTHHPTNRFNNVIRVTIRNRGAQMARNTEVYLYWADPATSLPFPASWNSTGFYVNGPGFVTQDNKIVVAQLAAGGNVPLDFAWAPPAPGSNIRGDDHFCLLVRIENEADASGIGTGGWSSITASNNIALRNVHVQESAGGDADLRFYVIGTDDIDGLTLINELLEGRLRIALPVQALPWRDMRIIEKLKGRRLPYGCPGTEDPLARMQLALKREEVELRTDIRGAAGLEVRDGLAIVQAGAKKLELPYLRLEAGTKMPVSVSVARPKFDKERRYVHVAQRSGGRLVGGVSLELRPRRKR